jgi:hypothetical protein
MMGARPIPCWYVDVRHERRNGRLGHFKSRPITWTEARKLARYYQAHGHAAHVECVEVLVALHKSVITGDMSRAQAIKEAQSLGYEVK